VSGVLLVNAVTTNTINPQFHKLFFCACNIIVITGHVQMEILKYKLLCTDRQKFHSTDPKSCYATGPLFVPDKYELLLPVNFLIIYVDIAHSVNCPERLYMLM
jgi:hypothetical protein